MRILVITYLFIYPFIKCPVRSPSCIGHVSVVSRSLSRTVRGEFEFESESEDLDVDTNANTAAAVDFIDDVDVFAEMMTMLMMLMMPMRVVIIYQT